MHFNLKRPCAHCPFRRDCRPGWLGRGGSERLVEALTQDRTFACHETLTEDEQGQTVQHEQSQHCAGALLVLERDPHQGGLFSNFLVRFAARFDLFDPTRLDRQAPVFASFAAFISHHT
jgi:hypothetical protein